MTDIENVSFRLEDDTAAREEARHRAIVAARRHAETYAAAEGRSVGLLVHLIEEDVAEYNMGSFAPVIEEPGAGQRPPSDPKITASLAAAPIRPGQITVRAGVTATFALGE